MNASADKYPNLDALKSAHRQGTDYRIRVLDRRHPITIISPHGGFIDTGTSSIAAAIAARNLNLYDFQGLQEENGLELHVTSTRFRDEALSRLLNISQLAVGVHSMGRASSDAIWLGGLNQELKNSTQQQLVASGFLVETQSPKYRGVHPANICNLAAQKGIQLELPSNLIEKMFATPVLFRTRGPHPQTTELLKRFATAVRAALRDHIDC